MKIVYEPHPVSAERKAELRAQGCKIIDERFKPAGLVADDAAEPAPAKAAPAKRKTPVKRKAAKATPASDDAVTYDPDR